VFLNGFTPGLRDRFDLLTWGSLDGTFDKVVVSGLQGSYGIHYNVNGFQLEAFTTAVPEPETYALMMYGLAGFALWARRRRSGASPMVAVL
jgi:hypothetical protein